MAIGRRVFVADLVARARLASWHPFTHPSAASFSHDERLLAVKSTLGELALLQVTDGNRVAHYCPNSREEGPVPHFSPCDTQLVNATWAGQIQVRSTRDLHVTQSFSFEREMITAVSPCTLSTSWLFAHKPVLAEGERESDRQPYLTLWKWPLHAPTSRIATCFDHLDAAALSPSADYIAAVGYPDGRKSRQLRLLTRSGDVVASTDLGKFSGTTSNTRWSPDSKLIATVVRGGFSLFEAPTLKQVGHIPAMYPSDIAFINGNAEVVIGTWESGRVVQI